MHSTFYGEKVHPSGLSTYFSTSSSKTVRKACTNAVLRFVRSHSVSKLIIWKGFPEYICTCKSRIQVYNSGDLTLLHLDTFICQIHAIPARSETGKVDCKLLGPSVCGCSGFEWCWNTTAKSSRPAQQRPLRHQRRGWRQASPWRSRAARLSVGHCTVAHSRHVQCIWRGTSLVKRLQFFGRKSSQWTKARDKECAREALMEQQYCHKHIHE